MKKKILIVLLIIIVLIPITDILLVRVFNKGPLFAINTITYKDGGSREYFGLGYKVIKCNTLFGDKTINIGFYSLEYNCDNRSLKKEEDYIIVDETEICADALEEIYRESGYTYYLSCIKSANMYLLYSDGNKVPLRVALNSGEVTIDELIQKGLKVYKYKT